METQYTKFYSHIDQVTFLQCANSISQAKRKKKLTNPSRARFRCDWWRTHTHTHTNSPFLEQHSQKQPVITMRNKSSAEITFKTRNLEKREKLNKPTNRQAFSKHFLLLQIRVCVVLFAYSLVSIILYVLFVRGSKIMSYASAHPLFHSNSQPKYAVIVAPPTMTFSQQFISMNATVAVAPLPLRLPFCNVLNHHVEKNFSLMSFINVNVSVDSSFLHEMKSLCSFTIHMRICMMMD